MATPTYTLIEEQVLGSSASSVTFSSIPSIYKDLVLEVTGSNVTGNSNLGLRFNGDTGTNYSRIWVNGNGSSAVSSKTTNANYLEALYWGTAISTGVVQIMSYANASMYKTTLSRMASTGINVEAKVGLWRNTAAITTISITGLQYSMDTGTTFRLWGIA